MTIALDGEADALLVTGPDAVAAALSQIHGAPLIALPIDRPVLRVNADYETLPNPINADEGARLQPDDWPPYADDAWAAQHDLAVDDDLRGLVVEMDRWRLRDGGLGQGSP